MNNNNNIDIESGLSINNPTQANKQNPSSYILIRVMTIASLIAFGFIAYLQTNQANNTRNILSNGMVETNLRQRMPKFSRRQIINAYRYGTDNTAATFRGQDKQQIITTILQEVRGARTEKKSELQSLFYSPNLDSADILTPEQLAEEEQNEVLIELRMKIEDMKAETKSIKIQNIKDALQKTDEYGTISPEAMTRMADAWYDHTSKSQLIAALLEDQESRIFINVEYDNIKRAIEAQ